MRDKENQKIGDYLREKRQALLEESQEYSLRSIAKQLQISHVYAGAVERNETIPSQERLQQWAEILNENSDQLLTRAGYIPKDVQDILLRNPNLYEKIREIESKKTKPIRDGKW